MPTAENGLIQIEESQTLVDFAAMTDSGDHTIFTAADDVFSGMAGFTPKVYPNGVLTGFELGSPAASGANDKVDLKAHTAYIKGVKVSVAAVTDFAVTRPVSNVAKICIVTVNESGQYTEVEGTAAADTTFSTTPGAAGGPPYIPADSYAVQYLFFTSSTAAPITLAEIKQGGQYTERSMTPSFDVSNLGMGMYADAPAKENAHVKFSSALPLIHTDDKPKKVYAEYYTPVFATIDGVDFKAPEMSHSVSSKQFYSKTVASPSQSLGQGGFTALCDDAINDLIVSLKNKKCTFKFFPDQDKTAYVLCQGKVGIGRTWPVSDQIAAAVTISSETEAAEFSE